MAFSQAALKLLLLHYAFCVIDAGDVDKTVQRLLQFDRPAADSCLSLLQTESKRNLASGEEDQEGNQTDKSDKLSLLEMEAVKILHTPPKKGSDSNGDQLAVAAAAFAVAEASGKAGPAERAALLQLLSDTTSVSKANGASSTRNEATGASSSRVESEHKQSHAARAMVTSGANAYNTAKSTAYAALDYADEAWTWGEMMNREYPNIMAFFLATFLLMFVVVGLFFCWADVEQLAIKKVGK